MREILKSKREDVSEKDAAEKTMNKTSGFLILISTSKRHGPRVPLAQPCFFSTPGYLVFDYRSPCKISNPCHCTMKYQDLTISVIGGTAKTVSYPEDAEARKKFLFSIVGNCHNGVLRGVSSH